MRKYIGIASALAIASCAPAPATTQREGTVHIHNHLGGYLLPEQERFRAWRSAGLRVELSGRIMSAGTMYLGYPNVCAHSGAIFGFHGVTPRTSDPAENFRRDLVLAQYYPPRLRHEYITHWRHSQRYTTLNRQQVQSLTGLANCED